MTAFATVWVEGQPFLIAGDPPAPIDYEQPPPDVDACEHCSGLGMVVVGLDEAERPIDETCGWCDGSGNRRGWTAGAA